mmetsp:Transcript_7474/g.17720  ORF Transcript_7474/g.17720 Transcript_7474/m.17720 type:complete len:430 (+) Transcript_7474:110-1399(+)
MAGEPEVDAFARQLLACDLDALVNSVNSGESLEDLLAMSEGRETPEEGQAWPLNAAQTPLRCGKARPVAVASSAGGSEQGSADGAPASAPDSAPAGAASSSEEQASGEQAPVDLAQLAAASAGDLYTGEVKSFNQLLGRGFIECEGIQATFGKDVYAHRSVLAMAGAKVGDIVQFGIHLNAQGLPQASSPMTVLQARCLAEHIGKVKSFSEKTGYGFIECADTFEKHGRDVYLSSKVAKGLYVGQEVFFNISLNGSGMPVATEAFPARIEGDKGNCKGKGKSIGACKGDKGWKDTGKNQAADWFRWGADSGWEGWGNDYSCGGGWGMPGPNDWWGGKGAGPFGKGMAFMYDAMDSWGPPGGWCGMKGCPKGGWGDWSWSPPPRGPIIRPLSSSVPAGIAKRFLGNNSGGGQDNASWRGWGSPAKSPRLA